MSIGQRLHALVDEAENQARLASLAAKDWYAAHPGKAHSAVRLRSYYVLDKSKAGRTIVRQCWGLKNARATRDRLQAEATAKGQGNISRSAGTNGLRFCITKAGG